MKEDGCDEVVLETEVTNKGSLALYERLGFIKDKRLCRYYLNGVDAFRYHSRPNRLIHFLSLVCTELTQPSILSTPHSHKNRLKIFFLKDPVQPSE